MSLCVFVCEREREKERVREIEIERERKKKRASARERERANESMHHEGKASEHIETDYFAFFLGPS